MPEGSEILAVMFTGEVVSAGFGDAFAAETLGPCLSAGTGVLVGGIGVLVIGNGVKVNVGVSVAVGVGVAVLVGVEVGVGGRTMLNV